MTIELKGNLHYELISIGLSAGMQKEARLVSAKNHAVSFTHSDKICLVWPENYIIKN